MCVDITSAAVSATLTACRGSAARTLGALLKIGSPLITAGDRKTTEREGKQRPHGRRAENLAEARLFRCKEKKASARLQRRLPEWSPLAAGVYIAVQKTTSPAAELRLVPLDEMQ